MDFTIEHKPAQTYAGLQMSGPYSELGSIPALWEQFAPLIESIPHNASPRVTYGVYQDRPDGFVYSATVNVDNGGELPEGVCTVTTPAAHYAKFTHRGPIAGLGETMEAAHRTLAEQGYQVDYQAYKLEYYDENFNPISEDSILYYLCPVIR